MRLWRKQSLAQLIRLVVEVRGCICPERLQRAFGNYEQRLAEQKPFVSSNPRRDLRVEPACEPTS